MELRGPANIHEAVMYVEHADVVLSRVSGQESSKKWHKQNANNSRSFNPPVHIKSTGGSGSGPEPMEIRAINYKPLTKEKRS